MRVVLWPPVLFCEMWSHYNPLFFFYCALHRPHGITDFGETFLLDGDKWR